MKSNKQISEDVQASATQLLQIFEPLEEVQLNKTPFEGSWTAAHVAEHLLKSNSSIEQALKSKGNITERDINKEIEGLKKTFLDFTTKMKSPDFILPSKVMYNKEVLIQNISDSFAQLTAISNSSNLAEVIVHPALGEISKLEMLHFVVYHTQRHIHQLKNITQKI